MAHSDRSDQDQLVSAYRLAIFLLWPVTALSPLLTALLTHWYSLEPAFGLGFAIGFGVIALNLALMWASRRYADFVYGPPIR